jgi:hypothetical protein
LCLVQHQDRAAGIASIDDLAVDIGGADERIVPDPGQDTDIGASVPHLIISG